LRFLSVNGNDHDSSVQSPLRARPSDQERLLAPMPAQSVIAPIEPPRGCLDSVIV